MEYFTKICGGCIMTCLEAQRLITAFINDQLNVEQLEAFVSHITSCPDCMEELEVYYVLLTAMKQLDEEKNLSNDYHIELLDKIQHAEDKIVHSKFVKIRKRILFFLTIVIVGIVSSVGVGVVEEVILNNKEPSIQRFRIENSFTRYNNLKLPAAIESEKDNILLYLNPGLEDEDSNNIDNQQEENKGPMKSTEPPDTSSSWNENKMK